MSFFTMLKKKKRGCGIYSIQDKLVYGVLWVKQVLWVFKFGEAWCSAFASGCLCPWLLFRYLQDSHSDLSCTWSTTRRHLGLHKHVGSAREAHCYYIWLQKQKDLQKPIWKELNIGWDTCNLSSIVTMQL